MTGAGTTGDAPAVWQGLDPALLRLRRLECVVGLGAPLLVGVVLLAVLAGPTAALLTAVAGTLAVLLTLRAVTRRFASWGWAEREDDLLLRRGVLVQRTTMVPYGRMQFVDITSGPLDRRLGLASVVLHTAAASATATVPGLRAEQATRLRDRLAALGEARAAGV